MFDQPQIRHGLLKTRRHFFRDCQLGLGAIALRSLLADESAGSPVIRAAPFAPREPHFAPRATNVIFLHMAGSPPHLDLFDYKPALVKRL